MKNMTLSILSVFIIGLANSAYANVNAVEYTCTDTAVMDGHFVVQFTLIDEKLTSPTLSVPVGETQIEKVTQSICGAVPLADEPAYNCFFYSHLAKKWYLAEIASAGSPDLYGASVNEVNSGYPQTNLNCIAKSE